MKRIPKWAWAVSVIVLITLISAGVIISFFRKSSEKSKTEVSKETSVQIYPNYVFQEGVNKIKVPLIPTNQLLSQEAGGWVIVPVGSRIRIDYTNPVIIENIDGKKFYRELGKPAWDGVNPGNGIFRLYGEGYAEVTIKRGVY